MPRLTLDSLVRDVLKDYPRTGEIFIQHGKFSRPRRGDLYPTYDPGLTVAAFAAATAIDPMSLLNLLRAAAEGHELERQLAAEAPRRLTGRRQRAWPAPTIGYTGSYREPSEEIDVRPVVQVQTARGPV